MSNSIDYRSALDRILPSVEKPARYAGGEWNSVIKDSSDIRARIALCFPDTYEIGMSHLGLKILYSLLNKREGWSAERVYAPWPDMEARLRENGIPLVSLESYTPLSEFDIVGFSLQYELTYTNVLTMLDVGGIPLHTADRTRVDPLVIAGGPTVYSGEPIADFIDVFVIGDGEEAFPALIDRYIELRDERPDASRLEILRELALLGGMYVPSLYPTSVSPHHGLLKVDQPADRQLPFPVLRQVVDDINRFPFPSDSPVSAIEAVHDRVAIEIARGCVDGCRFCQAGTIYRPVRERDPKQIVNTIIDGIQQGGYDETSLTSLSTADYTCLEPLVKMLGDELEKRKVSFSVSSLRASGVTESLAREIARVRRTGFTIAPEAGTQRMRDVINKNVTEEDVLNSCSVAFSEGWSSIKMYFMIGLPTETDEDVTGIAELGRKVRELGRAKFNKAIKVTCSASYFVPKPHTPFQWCQQEDIESIKRKQRLLKDLGRRYRIEIKVHHAETSLLEGVISRGDRALCRVIERAWRKGCRFDGWTERFDFEAWMQAFHEEGIPLAPYLKEFPVREAEGPQSPLVQLPWDHIDTLVKREFQAREYIKGIKARISPPCGLPVKIIDGRPTAIAPSHEDFERVAAQPLLCYNCGLECDLTLSREHLQKAVNLHQEVRSYRDRMAGFQLVQLGVAEPVNPAFLPSPVPSSEPRNRVVASEADSHDEVAEPPSKKDNQQTQQIPLYRYRAWYAKLDGVKYLSHLDLTRSIPRAFRRAGIELGYSLGFHPMPLIQYGPALGVGAVGENELMDFSSVAEMTESDFLNRMNRVLPAGMRFNGLEKLEAGSESIVKAINRAEYHVPADAPEITATMDRLRTARPEFEGRDLAQLHEILIEEFMSRTTFVIERAVRDKKRQVDVRRFVRNLESSTPENILRLVTEITPNGGVKPVEVVAAVYGLTDEEKTSLSSQVRRIRLYRDEARMTGVVPATIEDRGMAAQARREN